jgi:hypothetical protein
VPDAALQRPVTKLEFGNDPKPNPAWTPSAKCPWGGITQVSPPATAAISAPVNSRVVGLFLVSDISKLPLRGCYINPAAQVCADPPPLMLACISITMPARAWSSIPNSRRLGFPDGSTERGSAGSTTLKRRDNDIVFL